MGSKISNTEWGLVIGALATVDAVQALLDLLLIGPFVNSFIAMAVTASFTLYLKLRGVKFNNGLVGGLVIGFLIESVPLVPFLGFLPAMTAMGIKAVFEDFKNKKLKKPSSPTPEQGNQQLPETQK